MKIERVHHLKYDSEYEDVKLHETTRNYQSGGFCRPKVGCYPWVCLAVEPIANKDHDKQQTEGTDWASININNAVLEPKNRSIYISNSLDHRNTLGFGNVFCIIWPSKTGISYDIARNHSCSTNVVFFSATHGDWAQDLMWFDPKRWNDLILTPHGNKDNQQDNPRPRLAYFCFYSAYHMTRIVPVPSGRLPLLHCLPQPHRGTSGKTCGKAQKRCRNWLLWRVVVKKQNGTLKLFYLRICWEVLYQSELPGQSNRLISSLVTDKLWCWLISASDRHGQ